MECASELLLSHAWTGQLLHAVQGGKVSGQHGGRDLAYCRVIGQEAWVVQGVGAAGPYEEH